MITPIMNFYFIFFTLITCNGFVSRGSTRFYNTHSHKRIVLTPLESSTTVSIVEQCYDTWNQRKMDEAANLFAPNFSYDDGQYLGSITKKPDLERLFQRWANVLPPNSSIVIDKIAKCPNTGNVGTQWHVEEENGSTVPYTRGCSFYTIDKESGLIKTGFKVSEMIVKPSKQFSDALVNSASNMIQTSEKIGNMFPADKATNMVITQTETESSIIESYFNAWNNRDIDAALNLFVNDCTYETEDPVFVDTLRGKEALREHLERNAAALPSGCKIILDDLAIDSINETIGVKWHLEVNGMPIPNLRGCSIYTMEKGLLKTGFDVTEAPVKLPAVIQDLALPFAKFMIDFVN